jgi:hypothetical protein
VPAGRGPYRRGLAATVRPLRAQCPGSGQARWRGPTWGDGGAVSGGVSTKKMTAPSGMTHLVRRRQAAMACSARIALSAWHAQTREELRTRGPVRTGRLYGVGATAMPPRAANPGAVRGGLANDKRAPHVSTFPFSEILKNSFPHKKNRYKLRKNLRKFLKVGNRIWNTFHH